MKDANRASRCVCADPFVDRLLGGDAVAEPLTGWRATIRGTVAMAQLQGGLVENVMRLEPLTDGPAAMKRWRNFDADQVERLVQSFHLSGCAQTQVCPSCGARALHWYSYRNPFRTHTRIGYVWCSSCRRYFGQTTGWPGELPDPLDGPDRDGRMALEADLDIFFGKLDSLWRSGALPQSIGGS